MVMPRKADHIDICLNEDVNSTHNYWHDINFVHHALPEMDLDDIDLSTDLFGKKLKAPLVISAITGGFDEAAAINENLAVAAGKVGVGLGVGSQRAAIEEPKLVHTYDVVKGKGVPLLIANVGAPQLIEQGGKRAFTLDDCRTAMDMIDGDILAIHMNYLQEIVQLEGDSKARGIVQKIADIAGELPVLAKETGAGISRKTALMLKEAGVKGFDVGGLSGTSWAAVEYYRAKKDGDKQLEGHGTAFWNWGIPTPVSLRMSDVGLPMIATGGLWSGLDVAKSVAMGATAGGMARRVLEAAVKSPKAVEKELNCIISELRVAMFLTGSKSFEELRNADMIITGKTKEMLKAMEEKA